jgi:CrcB protein
MSAILLVGLGGILGANARYFVSLWAARRIGTDFPYGTLIVNVSGSIVLGFVLAFVTGTFATDAAMRYLIATGFLGSYTTFSTFVFESLALVRQGDRRLAAINVFGSAVLGFAGSFAGVLLGLFLAGAGG